MRTLWVGWRLYGVNERRDMKQCLNCKAIMADGATFCPKCGTPSAAKPDASAAPATPATAPATPAASAAPATPTSPAATTPLTNPSSAINGFGAIASTPAAPAPTPAPEPTPTLSSSTPITPSTSAVPTASDDTATPITPDTPPAPLKDKKAISGKGLKMPGRRTLILIAIVVVLIIGAIIAAIVFMSPSTNETPAETPVAPAAEKPVVTTTNKALLSGYSFEIPSDYTMELFTDINGNPVLQIANSDNGWVMDLTYLSSTLFSTVSAEGAMDNQIMLLNAQTNSEATAGQATLSDIDLHFITTTYNNVPVTIVYAQAPAVEGNESCTFAGIVVSKDGESGEAVLEPAAEIFASAVISTTNPLSEIAEGTDFSGLISILGQGFSPAVDEPTPIDIME